MKSLQSSAVSMAFRNVSYLLSLPFQYRSTYTPGRPEELSQKKVANLELRKIRIALKALSGIPELDCFTVQES